MDSFFDTKHLYRCYFKMAFPVVLGLVVTLVYNLADTFFIAQTNDTNLIAGVSLCAPVFTALMAFGNIYGQGGSSLISRLLGQQDGEGVKRVSSFCFYIALVTGIVLAVLMTVFNRPLLTLLGADADTLPHAFQYYIVLVVCAPIMVLSFIHSSLVRCEGMSTESMIGTILGAVINIILDPILIFGLFGFPRMEVAGAALATVLGQILAACLSIFFNLTRNHDIQFQFRGFRPDGRIIARIYSVGIPSIIMQSIGSVMVFGMNKILISFTTTATAVFGVYFKLQSFIFMPVFGLNNGMVPIVAYNYGARRPDRIMKTIKLSITYAVCIMLVGLLIFQFAPDVMLNLFRAEGDSGDMLTIGVPALRIISLSFLFAGYAIVCSSVFQALGHGVLSLAVSVVRQLVVLLPVGFLLSLTGKLELVWWAFPIAELFSLTLCTIFLRRVYLHEIKPLSLPKK